MQTSFGTSVVCTKKKDLDRIQDEAAIIVTGATKLVSLMVLHNDVCWDLLQERRQKHKLIQFFLNEKQLLSRVFNISCSI